MDEYKTKKTCTAIKKLLKSKMVPMARCNQASCWSILTVLRPLIQNGPEAEQKIYRPCTTNLQYARCDITVHSSESQLARFCA